MTYLATHPRSVLLIDEPDAHLEILRQREVYRLLATSAEEAASQVVIASHSEVVLNEAADRDVVVAFVGKPHRIDDRGTQLLKALKELGYEEYYQAEEQGWVLYLEGSTDLAILQAFAESLDHPAREHLERPFVHYIGNQPAKARDHFYGLKEGQRDLVGLIVTDRLDREARDDTRDLWQWSWRRREIENYLCGTAVLRRFAAMGASERAAGPLFEQTEVERSRRVMEECIEDLVPRVALRDPDDAWWHDVEATDEFLDRLFARYFEALDLPNLMRKSDDHRLAACVTPEEIDPEVGELLDLLVEVASRARPVGESG